MEKIKTRWPVARAGLSLFTPLLLLALTMLPQNALAQTAQERESIAQSYLVQADDAYAKGDYQKAIESYLLVVQTSANKMNLSRAHMGLSLCYFYLNDTENAKRYILRVLQLDPQKEVSSLFHPQTYVDLFNEVKKENEGKLGEAFPVEPVEVPRPEVKPPVVPEEKPLAEELIAEEKKGGHWEFGLHFSYWSIDPAKSAFEGTLTKKAANEIRDHVTDQLNILYGGKLVRSSHEQSLALDSSGSNYGFEIRYYPLGRRGSMSVGLSFEKTKVKVTIKGPVTQRFSDGSAATVEGDAIVETSPFTTDLSFRWDFFSAWRVRPYFVLGFGVGPLNGTANYSYTGTYTRGGSSVSVEGGEDKSFDELREEGEIELDVFILFHTAIGVKGEIYKGLMLKAEAGFWDGLILRAGLAFRF
ncbi:MAG: tetratricopeptide repeat protein [Acidobacteriota bacterium]